MGWAFGISARPPPWAWLRRYGSAEAFLTAMDRVAAREPEAIAELDAIDQIGEAVIEAVQAYFAEDHNRRIVENLSCRTDHPRRRDAPRPTPPWPAKRWCSLAPWSG